MTDTRLAFLALHGRVGGIFCVSTIPGHWKRDTIGGSLYNTLLSTNGELDVSNAWKTMFI